MGNKTPEASEEFWNAIIDTSSIVIDCQLCGRTHYSTEEPYNFKKGQLEELERQHKENPDKCIEHAEKIFWGYLDGKQAVYTCPCDKVAKYEKIFWNSRRIIAKYFEMKAEKIREFSENTSKLAESVKNLVDAL